MNNFKIGDKVRLVHANITGSEQPNKQYEPLLNQVGTIFQLVEDLAYVGFPVKPIGCYLWRLELAVEDSKNWFRGDKL